MAGYQFELLDDEGPTAVGLIANCKDLRALPRSGGVLAQDSLFIHLLNAYNLAEAEKRELDSKRAEARAKRKQRSQ